MPDIALNTGDTAAVLIALSEKSKGQVRRGKKMNTEHDSYSFFYIDEKYITITNK